MKSEIRLSKASQIRPWVFIIFLVIAAIGCKPTTKYRQISFLQLEQHKTFKATVISISIYDFGSGPGPGLDVNIFLQAEQGERIAIGSERSPLVVADFARTLRGGATYEFPKIWLEYKAIHGPQNGS
jgi:hypothetical protein